MPTAALLDQVGLGDKYGSMPANLSGGQKQRVAIARALAGEPNIILADEPTGSLDSQSGRMVMELMRRLTRERNHTVVLVTHDNRIWTTPTVSFTLKTEESTKEAIMKRIILYLSLSLFLLGAVVIHLTKRSARATPPESEAASNASADTIAAPGLVEPLSEEIKVGSEIAGKLRAVLVEEGDRVRGEQVVAVLENDDYCAQRPARAQPIHHEVHRPLLLGSTQHRYGHRRTNTSWKARRDRTILEE